MQTGKKNHQSLIYSSSTDTGYYISRNYEILTNAIQNIPITKP